MGKRFKENETRKQASMNIQILKKMTPSDRCYKVGNQKNGDLIWEELRKDNAKREGKRKHT